MLEKTEGENSYGSVLKGSNNNALLSYTVTENDNTSNVAKSVWGSLSLAEKWETNRRFLDKAIQSGHKFVLSGNAYKAKKGTYFYKEIQYLLSKGYKIIKYGWEMVKK